MKRALNVTAISVDLGQPVQTARADLGQHLSLSVHFPDIKEPAYLVMNPFPNKQILDSSKIKEFAEDSFTFDEKWQKGLRKR